MLVNAKGRLKREKKNDPKINLEILSEMMIT
jgi:hypothetical protein